MVDGAYRMQSGSEMSIEREWEDKEEEKKKIKLGKWRHWRG